MGESAKRMERKLHLKLPAAMLATVLRPTGCRNSPEAEAAWRLGAAAVAVRELRPKGIIPIFKDVEDYRDDLQTRELHIPLKEDDLRILTQVSVEEGGSRGELVRKLLLSAQRIIDDCPGSLNHDGLVALMIAKSLPFPEVILAEW